MRATLTPERRRLLVVAGLLAAVVAIVVLVVASTQRGPATSAEEPPEPPPVVLVPGYGGITTGLDVLATALRDDGRSVAVADLGTASLDDLHVQAQIVEGTVNDVLSTTGSSKVDVVGYSAGGIAVRLWAAAEDHASLARRIVTLSSPHHGTEQDAIPTGFGPTPCPVACHQLVAASSLIRSLADGVDASDGPDWVSIWSEDDGVVVPATSSRLEGALNFSVQSICPGVTVHHQGVPSNPTVIAMVRHVLGSRAPSVPDSSVCRARATQP